MYAIQKLKAHFLPILLQILTANNLLAELLLSFGFPFCSNFANLTKPVMISDLQVYYNVWLVQHGLDIVMYACSCFVAFRVTHF